MVIKEITPEALRISLISRPKDNYELSQILNASYKRTLKAIEKHGNDLSLPLSLFISEGGIPLQDLPNRDLFFAEQLEQDPVEYMEQYLGYN